MNSHPSDSTGEPCLIGVDGGATKTALILTDARGRLLDQQNGPGCSPSHLGPDGARALINRLLHRLVARPAGTRLQIEATLLFMAGAPAFWKDFAAGLNGFGRVETYDDSRPVLQLACGPKPGLALHCGTGSFVAARGPDGRYHYAGGLGWRLGDPGSSHDLGTRAARLALMELDGWSPSSEVSRMVTSKTGQTGRPDLLRFIYTQTDPNSLLAGLAPDLVHLADDGSAEAGGIIRESLEPLVGLASTVASRLRLPPRSPCGLSGRLFRSRAGLGAISDLFKRTSLDWQINPITDEPIEGVRQILALRG
ncbi:MAG: BadF/BadG/BcrA/BcrD ATPase family protein [Opitutaceae bacterium]